MNERIISMESLAVQCIGGLRCLMHFLSLCFALHSLSMTKFVKLSFFNYRQPAVIFATICYFYIPART